MKITVLVTLCDSLLPPSSLVFFSEPCPVPQEAGRRLGGGWVPLSASLSLPCECPCWLWPSGQPGLRWGRQSLWGAKFEEGLDCHMWPCTTKPECETWPAHWETHSLSLPTSGYSPAKRGDQGSLLQDPSPLELTGPSSLELGMVSPLLLFSGEPQLPLVVPLTLLTPL